MWYSITQTKVYSSVVPCLSLPGGPGAACCCSGAVGAYHWHQRHSTPWAIAHGAGGGWCVAVMGPAGSFPVIWVCWCQGQCWHCCWVIMVGPRCSFLIIVGACCHPLTLSNLQVGACSSGSGWWVSAVMEFCFFGGVGCISVMWHTYGGWWVLTRQLAPLLGGPGIPLHPPSHVNSLVSHLNWEEGVGWLVHVFCHGSHSQ